MFDGIKGYTTELGLKTAQNGDLDYDCDLDQYTKKKQLVVRFCEPVGHTIVFKSLMIVPELYVILKN